MIGSSKNQYIEVSESNYQYHKEPIDYIIAYWSIKIYKEKIINMLQLPGFETADKFNIISDRFELC